MTATILGVWIFTGFLYQGRPWAPPNPDLRLRYEFAANGLNTLKYWREGERGFCERQAQYVLNGDRLEQKVVWINPDNASSCGQDPDMQLGRSSQTRLLILQNEMQLFAPLGDEELIYLWKRE